MDSDYIYLLESKRSGWKGFQEMFFADTLEAAQGYMGLFNPELHWWKQRDNMYARLKFEDGRIVTYRITRRTVVTQKEVDDLKAFREAKAAERQANAASA